MQSRRFVKPDRELFPSLVVPVEVEESGSLDEKMIHRPQRDGGKRNCLCRKSSTFWDFIATEDSLWGWAGLLNQLGDFQVVVEHRNLFRSSTFLASVFGLRHRRWLDGPRKEGGSVFRFPRCVLRYPARSTTLKKETY